MEDALHLLLVRKVDIVEDAPAQEGVGQLLLGVGGDDDDGPLPGPDGLPGLRDVELHLVQLPQKVVGEFQVRLVDLVDQQDHLLFCGEGLPQLAQLDVTCDVVHAVGPKLAVVEPLDHVVDVKTVLGLGGGLHIPDDQLFSQGLGHGLRQHGFARTRLALDKQRLFQRHGDVHRRHQLAGGYVLIGSRKNLFHMLTFVSMSSRPLRGQVRSVAIILRYQSRSDSASADFASIRPGRRRAWENRRIPPLYES